MRRAASAAVGVAGAAGALTARAGDTSDALRRGPGALLGGDGGRSEHVDLKRVCGGGPGESERACDIFSNNSKTPFQSLFGTVTPSDLHFERSHSGTPSRDAATHQLLVHGLSVSPTVFRMDELYRMPSITRMAFIECAGNGWDNDPTRRVAISHKRWALAASSAYGATPMKSAGRPSTTTASLQSSK